MGKYSDMAFGGSSVESETQPVKYSEMAFGSNKQEEPISTIKGDGPSPTPAQAVENISGVAKSAGTGIARGIMDILGTPGFLKEIASKPAEYLSDKMLSMIGVPPLSKEEKEQSKTLIDPPTSGQIEKFVSEKTGIDFYDPQTRPEKYIQGATRGAAGSVLAPARAIPQMVKLGAAGGLGSEIAGELSNDNQIARLAGGIAGSTLAGVPGMARGNAGNLLKDALKDVDPADINTAIAAHKTAREIGVPIMGPEALPRGPIQNLAADVAASKTGGGIIFKFSKDRPEQIAKALSDEFKKIDSGIDLPGPTLQRGQKAATDVIGNAEKNRTAQVSPDYEAAKDVEISKNTKKEILATIKEARKNAATKSERQALSGIMDDVKSAPSTVGAYDNIYKTWRDNIDLPDINAKSIDKTTAHSVRPVIKYLDETLTDLSPDLARGREKYKEITETVLDPLNAGPIGKMAGKGADAAITPTKSMVLNNLIGDPDLVRPETIKQVVKELGKVDPEAVPKLLRLYFENALDSASKVTQAGENRMAGANFIKGVYGTPQQRANIKTMIKEIATQQGRNPEKAWRGFENTLTTLSNTGKVPGVGSPTAQRMETNQATRSNILAAGGETISTTPLKQIGNKLRDMSSRTAYKKLAEVFTDEDSVKKMVQMAKVDPFSPEAQILVSNLLQMNRELGSDDGL